MASAWGRIVFPAAEPFQDDVDIVPGRMVLARSTANIAGKFCGWYRRGWSGEVLAYLQSPWGYDEPENFRYSIRQFGSIGADGRK